MDTGEHTINKTEGWEAPKDADPFNHWVTGIAAMGETAFSMPIITKVAANLYQGGYVPGIDLGHTFDYILSLYPWHKYPIDKDVVRKEVALYDSFEKPDTEQIKELAAWVNQSRDRGPTLVHCQAGLNRSALVTAAALILKGTSAQGAIALLRAERSPAVLCNPNFETWLYNFEKEI